MSVLFGGNLADELAESVRQQKEDFDSIDIDTHFKRNQWKSKSADVIVQRNQDQNELSKKLQLSKSEDIMQNTRNNDNNEDLDAFINNDNDCDIDNDNDNDDVEYLDVRGQTIFRYSNAPKISKYDKKKNAKTSQLSYIQDNNVRTSFKNDLNTKKKNIDEDTYFKSDPFMDQKLLRQNFVIDRKFKDHSKINDQQRVQKLARNNLQFIKEVVVSHQKEEMKKSLLFDKRRFNRKLRFAIGAPNKRRQRNYVEFQKAMRNRQNDFDDKKDLYLERGLRVQNKLNDKVLFSKYGRKKIWNAGRTKNKKGKRKGANVGGYEFAKSINEW